MQDEFPAGYTWRVTEMAAARWLLHAMTVQCLVCHQRFMCLQDESSDGWTWRGPEMAAARRLLRVMTVHCLRCVAGGAACLRRLAVVARAASSRGVLSG